MEELNIANAVITAEAQEGIPAPVTPVPQTETKPSEAPKEATPSAPSPDVEAHKKQNAAFANMRRAKRELERKAVEAKPATTPPQEPAATPAPAKPEPVVTTAVPAQPIAEGIEQESEKAIVELSEDKQLKNIPGGVYDIVSLVDSDPRLMRLHGIDPKLAFREAKDMYLAKAGIATPPPVPKSPTPSGGMGGGVSSLDALYAETQKYPAGSYEWHKAVDAFNAERNRQAAY